MRRPARLVQATKPRLIRMVGVVGRVRREPPPGIDAAPSLLPAIARRRCACGQPDGSLSLRERAGSEEALQCGCLCYLWLQRSLRSRLIVCVSPAWRRGAGGGQSPPPPVPGSGQQNRRCAVPSTYPCRLRVGPRQRPCKHGPQPASMRAAPACRNVSAILRPSAPAVSARKVNKLTTGRTNVGRVGDSRHPAQNRLRARCPCPAALLDCTPKVGHPTE